MIVIGVDVHKQSLTAVAVNAVGRANRAKTTPAINAKARIPNNDSIVIKTFAANVIGTMLP